MSLSKILHVDGFDIVEPPLLNYYSNTFYRASCSAACSQLCLELCHVVIQAALVYLKGKGHLFQNSNIFICICCSRSASHPKIQIKEGHHNISHSSLHLERTNFHHVSFFSVKHCRLKFLWYIMKGVCGESVWLKSRTEHVNWTKLSTLSCSPSDFTHTLSSETPAKIL